MSNAFCLLSPISYLPASRLTRPQPIHGPAHVADPRDRVAAAQPHPARHARREHHPHRHGLAVPEPADAGRGLERVGDRVAEVEDLPLPREVALVRGHGRGLELDAAAHREGQLRRVLESLALMHEDPFFAGVHMSVGLSNFTVMLPSKTKSVPLSGSIILMHLGTGRATALTLLGDRLPAEKAADWGLVWQCVDDAALAKALRERRIAVLFSDIRGFSTMAERLSAREISEIVGRHLGVSMTDLLGGRMRDSVRGITHLGGTILGTVNKGNPFEYPVKQASYAATWPRTPGESGVRYPARYILNDDVVQVDGSNPMTGLLSLVATNPTDDLHAMDGFLLPPEAPQPLAECLAALARDRSMLARLSLAARRRFLQHPGWQQSCQVIREFLLREMVKV